MRRRERLKRCEKDGAALLAERPQALDVSRAEGQRLADHGGTRGGGVNLQADGQVPREQSKADGHAVRVQARAHQMIEVVPMEQLVQCLLDPLALAVGRR